MSLESLLNFKNSVGNLFQKSKNSIKKFVRKTALVTSLTSSIFFFSCEDPDPEPILPGPVSPTEENRPPAITSTPPTEVDELDYHRYDITAKDPDGNEIFYSLVESPDWVSLIENSVYGRAPQVERDTVFNVQVRVSDGDLHDEQSYGLNVRNLYNVHVLPEDQLNKLSKIDENSIIFSETTNFSEGDVIIGGISNMTPYGILREIKSISSDGKEVNTERASLEHAIREGTFLFNQPLSSSDVKLSPDAPKGITKSYTPGFEFSYNLDNVVLYDSWGQTVSIDGNISFNLTPYTSTNFDEKSIEAKLMMDEKVDIKLNSNLSLFISSQQKSFPLAYLKPIPVGTTGIVITPRIDMIVGIKPAQLSPLETRVIQEADLKLGLLYKNRSWKPISNFSNEFDFSVNRVNLGKADIEVYAGPFIKLFFNDYGLISPGVQAGTSGDLRFESASSSDWKLFGGVSASVGIDPGRFFKMFISPYAQQVIGYEKLLAESVPGNLEGKIFYSKYEDYDGNVYTSANMYMVDPNGANRTIIVNTPNIYDEFPEPSPDGSQIAFSRNYLDKEGYKIYIMDIDTKNTTRLTDNNDDIFPSWSPDGNQIAYNSQGDIWIINTDGTNKRNITQRTEFIDAHPSWSPDGNRIVFDSYPADGSSFDRDIYKVNINTNQITRLTFDGESREAVWSPNEDLIAYISRRTSSDGRFFGPDIYIMDSQGIDQIRVTSDYSNTDEYTPSWSPDGRRLVYMVLIPGGRGHREFWAVDSDGTNNQRILSEDGISLPKWGAY